MWPWDIVKMYVVLLTESHWHRNSTGGVADFRLGRERHFVARRVKTGVDDLRRCGREICLVYSRITWVKLRRDLLLHAASVINHLLH